MTDMADPEDVREMSMDFGEFCDAIVAVATLRPAKKKSDPFHKTLEQFCEAMLSQGVKKFM